MKSSSYFFHEFVRLYQPLERTGTSKIAVPAPSKNLRRFVTMKATRIILAAMVLGTAIGASQASAQSCSSSAGSCVTTNTASVTVGTLVKLDLGSASTALTAPTPAQIEAGALIANAGPTFSIKANKAWTLKIKSLNAATWTYTGSDAGVKSISDLLWSNAVNG